MTKEELDSIREEDMLLFLHSELGKRMVKAEAAGLLKRESQFVMGISSDELGPNSPGGETLLIQGIIDACFREDSGWILVDYKTDRVSGQDGERMLRKRYQVQLDSYKRALEQMTEIPVKECWIYSFALRRGFRLDEIGDVKKWE